MNHFENDDIPILSETHPQRSDDSSFQRNTSRTQSTSIYIHMASLDPYETQSNPVTNKNEHLLGSSTIFDSKLRNSLYGDAKGFGRKLFSSCSSCIPEVMNPESKVVHIWNKVLAIICFVAILVDPLFLFSFYVNKDDKCLVTNWKTAISLLIYKTLIDVLYLLNILIQFRVAYISPGSRGVGARDLIDHPKMIALNYLNNALSLTSLLHYLFLR